METQGYSLQGVLIVLHTACFPGVTKAPDRAVLFCAVASSSAASTDFSTQFYVLIQFLWGNFLTLIYLDYSYPSSLRLSILKTQKISRDLPLSFSHLTNVNICFN